ncbi:uncharacterized protein HaLaN_03688, partial [Haematococcus lacustris]
MLRLCASRLTSLAANARLEHTRLFATPSDTPRVMLVFGASGGIGAALVKALARDNPGAALILAVEGLVQGVLQRHKRLDAVANVVGNVMLQPAEPKDIAEALAFFMHPRTDFITGQVLAVDGGLSTLTKQQQA